jgi:hypothetical protein
VYVSVCICNVVSQKEEEKKERLPS